MKYASSVVDLIGNTPLLALDRINTDGAARLFGKCEFLNPIAVKDRPVLWMIQELGTKGAKARALEVHEATPGSFYVGQHDNPDNRKAHVETTGEEIWSDTEGRVDVFVAPMGTGGTVCGVSEALKPRKPELRVVGVEPEEAPFVSEGRFAPHRMMGTAPGFMPVILDRELIDEILLVSEDDAFETCRELARKEGILVGISSGASVCAALRLARGSDYRDKIIVCMLCDSGERYRSVDGLFDSG